MAFPEVIQCIEKSQGLNILPYFSFKKMREKEICPSVQSCNILIDSYGRSRQFEKCLQILEEMENNRLRPNVISYGSLLNCLCKDGRLLEAEVLFKHMVNRSIWPNVQIYNAEFLKLKYFLSIC
ncbi:unnamed protein product [Fraxinus pennsylvanica]|uniref:Pentatricopeptide repeat-containing protein n=1 Tax=Fraxinus pennsylvanica TaxID=56036 RepID=A0AAD1YQ34_9LAMI|nr:unnamed protein product [Fraxinus pennsylvanica]